MRFITLSSNKNPKRTQTPIVMLYQNMDQSKLCMLCSESDEFHLTGLHSVVKQSHIFTWECERHLLCSGVDKYHRWRNIDSFNNVQAHNWHLFEWRIGGKKLAVCWVTQKLKLEFIFDGMNFNSDGFSPLLHLIIFWQNYECSQYTESTDKDSKSNMTAASVLCEGAIYKLSTSPFKCWVFQC